MNLWLSGIWLFAAGVGSWTYWASQDGSCAGMHTKAHWGPAARRMFKCPSLHISGYIYHTTLIFKRKDDGYVIQSQKYHRESASKNHKARKYNNTWVSNMLISWRKERLHFFFSKQLLVLALNRMSWELYADLFPSLKFLPQSSDFLHLFLPVTSLSSIFLWEVVMTLRHIICFAFHGTVHSFQCLKSMW